MRWLTAAFSTFILLLIVLANTGSLRTPEVARGLMPFGDKVGHALGFGILTWLLVRIVPEPRLSIRLGFGRGSGPIAIPVVAIGLAILVTLEEASQMFIPTRSCSLGDLLADYAGMLAFGWLATRRSRAISTPSPISPSTGAADDAILE